MKDFIGDLWTDRDDRGVIKLGFARRFIEDVLGECFHVMQADVYVVRKGGPLMVIETNDGLTSLKSPLSGAILAFNAKARNFPDRLREDDVIMEVLPEGVKLAQKEKVVKAEERILNTLNREGIQRWWQDAQAENIINNNIDFFQNAQVNVVQPGPVAPLRTPEEQRRRDEQAARAARAAIAARQRRAR